MERSLTSSTLPALTPSYKFRPKSHSQSFEVSDTSTKPPGGTAFTFRLLSQFRQHFHQSSKISPELAAQVINQYILPMFQADARKRTDGVRTASCSVKKGRNRSVGARHSEGLEALPGTVLGEFKLSSLLSEELERTKGEMKAVQMKMREAEQAKVSILSELSRERQTNTQLEADLQLLQFQLLTYERIAQQSDAKLSLTTSQLDQYKDLYIQSETDRKRLSSLLHEEKWRNDIRYRC